MNCPKCGSQVVAEQKFCRACGESLQLITQRLPKPTSVAQRDSEAPENTDRTNRLLSWGLIMLFVGAAIGVIGKKVIHQEEVIAVGVLLALAGMFLSVFPYVLPPRRSKQRGGPPTEIELEAHSETRKSLPQERTTEYVSSVTERTTDLLTDAAVPRERSRD